MEKKPTGGIVECKVRKEGEVGKKEGRKGGRSLGMGRKSHILFTNMAQQIDSL